MTALIGVLTQIIDGAKGTIDGRLPSLELGLFQNRLAALELRSEQSAQRAAQLTYFTSMLVALGPILVIGLVFGVWLDHTVTNFSLTTYTATLIAGAVGAILSVMVRMSHGSFQLDPTVGLIWIRVLGFVRPFIGGIFGLVSYFALTSELLGVRLSPGPGKFYALCVIALAMGFNERWAKDMLVATQRVVLPGADTLDTERPTATPPLTLEPHLVPEDAPRPDDQAP